MSILLKTYYLGNEHMIELFKRGRNQGLDLDECIECAQNALRKSRAQVVPEPQKDIEKAFNSLMGKPFSELKPITIKVRRLKGLK